MRASLLFLSLGTVLCLSPNLAEAERSGWNFSPGTQYHIQTDEGPERFFRYQTSNGQYRKEKRLADGTVIGTEGWLDPLGYLRLKDYIADSNGFRILKSKMVYVGKERPIDDAVVEAKRVPAQTGILVNPVRPPNPFRESNENVPVTNDIGSFAYRPSPSTPVAVPNTYNSKPEYDGTYTVQNGFQYYLKRQYHEEEQQPNNGAVGSFGYIDPFGIRRVIYYKTDPRTGGFVHRKNNRYVGFAATPYDPTLSNLYRRSASSAINA
ncbi:uncharacterized protein LOC108632147 isoform X2 [Ceratina calcarata]|uniref:Uncharacterized protein LOC108632147 isoform X2 n=1 Tax=Ceratina calcarata TaxID=156304 RepID=A0AAJ7SBW3_9HYME|nr:uncharacterized protein LOC108632147 isoform X2 [Ceratina calcarata]